MEKIMESRVFLKGNYKCLVQIWVELHKQCESAQSSSAWQRITDAVNHESKTKSQVKRKIQNLKESKEIIVEADDRLKRSNFMSILTRQHHLLFSCIFVRG